MVKYKETTGNPAGCVIGLNKAALKQIPVTKSKPSSDEDYKNKKKSPYKIK